MHQSFAKNEVGRDFVVGDVHGCFDMLSDLLDEVEFDTSEDRLFSVGDLVDRGEKSADVLQWIARPWFHAVRGNHEDLLIRIQAGTADLGGYLRGGGSWFLTMDDDEQRFMAKKIAELPVCLDVETDDGKVGVVHAEVHEDNWDTFVHGLTSATSRNQRYDYLESAMWARDRIREKRENYVKGVAVVYVGHTPVDTVTGLGNVKYIDTGAVFGRKLSLVCIQGRHAGQVYELEDPRWK